MSAPLLVGALAVACWLLGILTGARIGQDVTEGRLRGECRQTRRRVARAIADAVRVVPARSTTVGPIITRRTRSSSSMIPASEMRPERGRA